MASTITSMSQYLKGKFIDYTKLAIERNEKRYLHKEVVPDITTLRNIVAPAEGEIRPVQYTVDNSMGVYEFRFVKWQQGTSWKDNYIAPGTVYHNNDGTGNWWLILNGNLVFQPLAKGNSSKYWFMYRAQSSGTSVDGTAYGWGKFYLIRYAPGGTYAEDLYTMPDTGIIAATDLTDNFQIRALPTYMFNGQSQFNRFIYTTGQGATKQHPAAALNDLGEATFVSSISCSRRPEDNRPGRLLLRKEDNGYGMIIYRDSTIDTSYFKNYSGLLRIISNGEMQFTFNNGGLPVTIGHVLTNVDGLGTLRWMPAGEVPEGTNISSTNKWLDAPDTCFRSSIYAVHYGSGTFHLDCRLDALLHVAMFAVETELYSYSRTAASRWYSTTYNYTDASARSEAHAPIFDTINPSGDPATPAAFAQPEWFGYIATNGYPTKVLTIPIDSLLYISYTDAFWRVRFMGNSSGPFNIGDMGMYATGLRAPWENDMQRDHPLHQGVRNTLVEITDYSNTHEYANVDYNNPIKLFENNGYGIYYYADSAVTYTFKILDGAQKIFKLGYVVNDTSACTVYNMKVETSTDGTTWTTVFGPVDVESIDDIDLGGVEAQYVRSSWTGASKNHIYRHLSIYAEPI